MKNKIIKNIISNVVFIFLGIAIFFFMQVSLIFLKDKSSNININEGQYILEKLNDKEKELLENERRLLAKQLSELNSELSSEKNKSKKKDIETKISNLKSKVSKNQDLIEKNKKESELTKQISKATQKSQSLAKELSIKNNEITILKSKNEQAKSEAERAQKTVNEYSDSIKEAFNELYTGQENKLKEIDKNFGGDKKQEMKFVINEIKSLSVKSTETADKSGDNESEAAIKKLNYEIASLKKKIASLNSAANTKTGLPAQLTAIESLLSRLYSGNQTIIQKLTSLKSGKSQMSDQAYITTLQSIIEEAVNSDKATISDKDKKIAKSGAEIIKLLKSIDELKAK